VTPADEGPSIHAVGDHPSRGAVDAFHRDGVVAERGHEAIALGWRGAAGGQDEEQEQWQPHLMPS
jgi:hypothetical protein